MLIINCFHRLSEKGPDPAYECSGPEVMCRTIFDSGGKVKAPFLIDQTISEKNHFVLQTLTEITYDLLQLTYFNSKIFKFFWCAYGFCLPPALLQCDVVNRQHPGLVGDRFVCSASGNLYGSYVLPGNI